MTHSSLPNIDQIRQRADLLRELRAFFDDRGFFEVQPPCLSRDCVVDAYIDPIEVDSLQLQLGLDLPRKLFLQPSPEAAMKRLLAAGAASIYSLGPAFRSGERGTHHNPEFTMMEWYEVDTGIDQAIALLGQLSIEMLHFDGFEVKTYRQVFESTLGFDPIETDVSVLREHVAEVDSTLVQSIGQDRDLMLDVLLSQLIQPELGVDQPVIVKNYPLSQAALAKQAADDPLCAARFELFVRGIELANGYDELREVDVLLKRSHANNQKRLALGKSMLPVESTLTNAMRKGLPPCSGVALGVDRLLLIRADKSSIADVMPFLIEFA